MKDLALLHKFCQLLQLGDIIGVPEVVTGGFLHSMYALETVSGKFAVKALNPQIMLRPTAKTNYIRSERIAGLAANRLPALPALRWNETFLHEVDGHYFLVFEWVDGTVRKPGEWTAAHCASIGEVLAKLHKTVFSELGIPAHDGAGEGQPVPDWRYYLELGQERGMAWVPSMLDAVDRLYVWSRNESQAAGLLTEDLVISHLDMDPKNVIWTPGGPIVIDWESAGWVNPRQDLLETALYWSETESGDLNEELFKAFIRAYQTHYGRTPADWHTVADTGFAGKLGWLEYNLKRSLRLECSDEDEQRLGTEQVKLTLDALMRYESSIPTIVKWLEE